MDRRENNEYKYLDEVIFDDVVVVVALLN